MSLPKSISQSVFEVQVVILILNKQVSRVEVDVTISQDVVYQLPLHQVLLPNIPLQGKRLVHRAEQEPSVS